ncbi:MAG: phosphate ABC transporter permease PstA [Roseiflexus sp.]|uniref:phosphate ABC transporter permease PstA n=1 Tax=Roseiflexus sp. TaxID=2562120 RepID=UPI0025E57978|nr:phosphate ABC transporter permease PstA [Roseiflexus sp.]MCL6540765.1 phosphate ABC transporter permease PstA [Roseiflexus sp.]
MSAQSMDQRDRPTGYLPEGADINRNIAARRLRGAIWQAIFVSSLIIGLLALATLIYTIVDDTFGYIAVQTKIDPEELTGGRPLEELSKEELIEILRANVSTGLFRRFDRDEPFSERSKESVLQLVEERVVGREVVAAYKLTESLLERERIEATVRERFPRAELEFHSWINRDFLTRPMSSVPVLAGVGNAILGSLWVIAITMLLAIPIGILGGVYLEEYASDTWYYRLIETNINNLAGVPSIIYGILGLAVFVRALEALTSGAMFGVTDSNGRTILSAGLTMALLVLPLMIINAREAIRAVPQSLRQASYGLGATKWQTVWHHVLPNALPGILTGTILSVSRAMGETAPLIVIGASTFVVFFPDSVFDKFTVIPIQIYNWTSQPGAQFRSIAAAAIIVLLVTLLALNATAILLRNRLRRNY